MSQTASPADLPSGTRRTLFHPAAGALVLGLDWILFSGTVFSAGLALWVMGILGFTLGGLGTGLIQRRLAGDSFSIAALKGLAGGLIVGAPFPVAGTVVGGAVLTLSGLKHWRRPALPGR